MDKREEILQFIEQNPGRSSSEIFEGLNLDVGYATVKRLLAQLMAEGLAVAVGKGRGTRYELAPTYGLLFEVDVEEYFQKEIDEREIKGSFNFSLINDTLAGATLFSKTERQRLIGLQQLYRKNIAELTAVQYQKELERLAVDLSWKSSQIEGNTYSLLETERLLKEKETAAGKTKDEAVMLLNHKEALDFLIANPAYLQPVSISRIEDIHSLLVKELGVNRNLRKRRVGISGTNYTPLDNEHQIREALESLCRLVNQREDIFEKALLLLVVLSYIQPFDDGNKRTARIVSNAVLLHNGYCPISFRTVDSIEYKKAMLIFYEQNNLYAFKKIFMDQFEFAVQTYF